MEALWRFVPSGKSGSLAMEMLSESEVLCAKHSQPTSSGRDESFRWERCLRPTCCGVGTPRSGGLHAEAFTVLLDSSEGDEAFEDLLEVGGFGSGKGLRQVGGGHGASCGVQRGFRGADALRQGLRPGLFRLWLLDLLTFGLALTALLRLQSFSNVNCGCPHIELYLRAWRPVISEALWVVRSWLQEVSSVSLARNLAQARNPAHPVEIHPQIIQNHVLHSRRFPPLHRRRPPPVS